MLRPTVILAMVLAAAPLAAGQVLRGRAPVGPQRDPAPFLREYDALIQPPRDFDRMDVEELLSYDQRLREWRQKRAALAANFAKEFPSHPRTGDLLVDRWGMLMALGQYQLPLDEIAAQLSGRYPPQGRAYVETLRIRAFLLLRQSKYGWSLIGAAIEQFITVAPDHRSAGPLIADLAERITRQELEMTLRRRIVERFPDARFTPASAQRLDQLKAARITPEPFPTESPAQREMLLKIRALSEPTTGQVGIDLQQHIEQTVIAQRQQARELNDLLKQFHDTFPDHPESLIMLRDRWAYLKQLKELRLAQHEAEELLSSVPARRGGARQLEALYAALHFLTEHADDDQLPRMRLGIERFRAAAPKDPRGAELLLVLARREDNPALRISTYGQIIKNYPGTEPAALATYDRALDKRDMERNAAP